MVLRYPEGAQSWRTHLTLPHANGHTHYPPSSSGDRLAMRWSPRWRCCTQGFLADSKSISPLNRSNILKKKLSRRRNPNLRSKERQAVFVSTFIPPSPDLLFNKLLHKLAQATTAVIKAQDISNIELGVNVLAGMNHLVCVCRCA